jgi:hypothetical protein
MACLKTGLSYFSSGGLAEAGTRTCGPGITERRDRGDRRTCPGIVSRLAESHGHRSAVTPILGCLELAQKRRLIELADRSACWGEADPL